MGFQNIEINKTKAKTKVSPLDKKISFNKKGLISVIVQENKTNEVLMFAWMNQESLDLTMKRQEMWYWSRSRNSLWKKGETSGNTQKLLRMYIDCDMDCLLAVIIQKGVACHTGKKTCFYRGVENTS